MNDNSVIEGKVYVCCFNELVYVYFFMLFCRSALSYSAVCCDLSCSRCTRCQLQGRYQCCMSMFHLPTLLTLR